LGQRDLEASGDGRVSQERRYDTTLVEPVLGTLQQWLRWVVVEGLLGDCLT
jgi:hypothetical protein